LRASAVGLTVFWSVSDPIGGRAILCTDPWASVAVHNSWLPGGLAVGAHPARVGEENSAGGQSLRWSAKVDIITVAIGRQSRRAGAASERSTFFRVALTSRCTACAERGSWCPAGQRGSMRVCAGRGMRAALSGFQTLPVRLPAGSKFLRRAVVFGPSTEPQLHARCDARFGTIPSSSPPWPKGGT